MKIEIKSMHLRNFKGIRERQVDFSHRLLIEGGNRMGKTTIYDAYLWCLFGQTSKPNSTIQPLDANNNVMHKLETSVTLLLDVDGRTVKIERRLFEDWTAKDTAEEKLRGTKTARFFDDVPCSVRLFNEKLNALCDIDKWMMLSNISSFFSLKIDDRRKILMSLAGDIDEKAIAQQFPIAQRGLIDEGKSITELTIQYKSTKKRATDDLNSIPVRIQAQDSLRVNADFAALRNEKAKLDDDISDIIASLEGSSASSVAAVKYEESRRSLLNAIDDAHRHWQTELAKQITNATMRITTFEDEKAKLVRKTRDNALVNEQNKAKLTSLETEFGNLRQQWMSVNDEKFDFSVTEVCPVCGRAYTEEMKTTEYNNAVSGFNKAKSERLNKIQGEATQIKEQMTTIKGLVNTYEQIMCTAEEEELAEADKKYNIELAMRESLQQSRWEESSEYNELHKQLAELEATKPCLAIDESAEERKKQMTILSARRDEVVNLLAGEQTNERIEGEKKRLDEESVNLAQIIADCNEALRQINAYKKAKINAVESKVNAYFSIVRWKFYEQNMSNDDLKDVCTAIDANGVNYENTNDGTVINMGVDIINGMSRAYNIQVPLFVDRKESAEDIVDTEQQTIFLQCVYAAPLNILPL